MAILGTSLAELFYTWREEVEGVIETEAIESFGAANEGLLISSD